MPEHYEVRIRKEALKFAASHMTVFPDGTKESLHGHQYLPTLTILFRDASFEKMIPFSRFKEAMKKIANLWDEKVLIATENRFLESLKSGREEVEFKLCGKRYVMPADEVVLLKVDNISCERLSEAYYEFIRSELEDVLKGSSIYSLSVYIEESPGQGAAYTHVSSTP
jgi:6-pyruvoyltetrahydropterin/6-carboxytetrahydropterin synthase